MLTIKSLSLFDLKFIRLNSFWQRCQQPFSSCACFLHSPTEVMDRSRYNTPLPDAISLHALIRTGVASDPRLASIRRGNFDPLLNNPNKMSFITAVKSTRRPAGWAIMICLNKSDGSVPLKCRSEWPVEERRPTEPNWQFCVASNSSL